MARIILDSGAVIALASRNPRARMMVERAIREERLLTLPAETIVMPGHGLDTTIATERPHLQEWVDRGW